MKRFLLFGIIILLLVALAACAATDPNNLFDVTTAEIEGTTEATKESVQVAEVYNGYYQYGNMQKNVSGSSFMLLGNEVLFLYVSGGNHRLYCYNLTTGATESYCEDAACKHNGCVASGLLGNLEVYNGKLYSLTSGWIPAEIEGKEKTMLTKAKVNGFFHHDGKLYARSADSSLVVFEDGSDKPRMIVEEFPYHWEVVFGQYLYANDNANVLRIDLAAEEPSVEVLIPNAVGITDGRYFYYADLKNYYLYRCDMDGSNAELLLEQPVLPASWNFDDEYFYYRLYTDYQLDDGPDTYDIYRFPKNDPAIIEKIATLPEPAFQVFTVPGTGKIFVSTWNRSNGEDNDLYVMNTDGSNLIRLEIPEH